MTDSWQFTTCKREKITFHVDVKQFLYNERNEVQSLRWGKSELGKGD